MFTNKKSRPFLDSLFSLNPSQDFEDFPFHVFILILALEGSPLTDGSNLK